MNGKEFIKAVDAIVKEKNIDRRCNFYGWIYYHEKIYRKR